MSSEPPTPLPPPPPSSGDDDRAPGEHGSDQGGGNDRGSSPSGGLPSNWPRWLIWVLIGLVAASFLAPLALPGSSSTEISYSEFLDRAKTEQIDKIDYDNTTAKISGEFSSGPDEGDKFNSTGVGLDGFSDDDRDTLEEAGVEINPKTPESNFFMQMLPLLLPIGLLIGFFWWMQRRAQGQVGGIMSIGRSKAKTYSTERPATLFDDVAGYEGVKREITEVVDFLKHPERFTEIGARIPKGVLLVGPPGTGKTLIARAVAGEAGVPFLSVSGSDFMEMFVGVGASRVRDLFESARKLGRAIIFVDEIDSIGRKRGAGLGGGHDEREQTLNQMLNEMDGFEPTEGIVMMAATNRPDILDPALLRPGRFDRQVVVPLPELSDRRAILDVHVKLKRMSDDVDLDVVARGTPGMSGADLANLVNEAALFAVREGKDVIGLADFENARDRVLIGQGRDSMVLSNEEKEAIAYHEAGHAICAAVLEHADPVHKVTIIPTGMALGVTQQLPLEERHIYTHDYIADSLVVRMGGRIAEDLVFNWYSTGAGDDLVKATELARRMVREWGMSAEVGPMAWGSQGEVFLGEDLMHSREYSDETARLIDAETEQILRAQEQRCRDLLTEHRNALDLVARALLEHETIEGAEVSRLVELANNGAAVSSGDDTEPDAAEAAGTAAKAAGTAAVVEAAGSAAEAAGTAAVVEAEQGTQSIS